MYLCINQFQDNQENFGPDDKGVLSPRRLHPERFSQFTKSSYIPEPAIRETSLKQQSRDGMMKSSYQYNGIDKYEKENNIRSVESSNYVSKEQARNEEENNHVSYDPLEPLRKNRNPERVSIRHIPRFLHVVAWYRYNGSRIMFSSFVNISLEEEGDS